MPYLDRKSARPGVTRRMRLVGHNYATPGNYFITICTHNRLPYFGRISDDEMLHTPAGQMVRDVILQLQSRFRTITTDSFVVMPNHIHMLLGVALPLNHQPDADNLIDAVHWIKTTVHQRFRAGVRDSGWAPYDGAVWQEGYHDHIVRNDQELEKIREYVANNVLMWGKDRFHDGMES